MVWRFHRSIFSMVVEMKEMVGFDMGEDSCGLTNVARYVLFQGGEYVKGKQRKIVLIREPEDMLTFKQRINFNAHYMVCGTWTYFVDTLWIS